MFATRTICSRCRSKVLAKPLAKSTAAAQRLTTSSSTTTDTNSPVPASKFREAIVQAAGEPVENADSILSRKRQRGTQRQNTKNRALHLFESTVNAAQQSESGTNIDAGQLYRLGSDINAALENKDGLSLLQVVAQCFAIVHDDILPVLRQPGGERLPKVTYAKATQAMRKLLEVKKSAWESPDLPRTADICNAIGELGMKSPGRLDPYITLLQHLLRVPDHDADPSTSSDAFDLRLLEDLVACWQDLSSSRHIYRARGLGVRRTGLRNHGQANHATSSCRAEFPLLASLDMSKLVVVLASTYIVLSDPRALQTARDEHVQNLLADLEFLVKPFDCATLQPFFSDYPDLWQYVSVRATWSSMQFSPSAKPPTAARPTSSLKHNAPNTTGTHRRISYAAWHKRLGSRFKANDVSGLNNAWEQLTNTADDPQRQEKLRNCPELFDFILHQCCSKQGPEGNALQQLAGRVLDYMEDIKLPPTIRTYTSMMEGWKIAKKLQPIEKLWAQVVKSGMQLDEHIWSSRIAAYGSLGRPDDGLRSLDEMNQEWEQACKNGSPSLAVQPGIASVNAAISGLLRVDRLDAVHRVLAWASERQIEPDIWTYNRLLSHMLKKGHMEEADRILTSMKTSGVAPDGATFTIILETALAEMGTQTPDSQRRTVAKVFAEMSACGIEPNQETYAKMLHVLVRAGNVARVPIEAVLAHLRGSGLQPSPEICTILFEYYFSRRPRDWDAIRALIADRRSRTRVLTDRVFWETVMRHLNSAGDNAGALEIFYDMDDWGIWPALPVLEPILRSLTDRGDWDAARQFVQTVMRQERSPAADQGGRYWKHAFWAIAKDYGLMEEGST
ncbi:hypothetical protein SODALDRAFT_277763 [Sodiomyces alkalinus F11]|uniref:Pentatricopeptide repeat domain-containing protein n=1 Tax=Sodiomyces alkalinus (strain CBS 110278 / VKM F-3762 / F11) TaxID=1314773 RepID=A0A3N2PWT2_SODAK|nr:hypothetical protein SODALDRAFT_277763 [Sodiomyces alkalinus F11]ROT38856.1 hypothetical protein SODALDRAFT_277763 [Sodiomyces alkalinus F11]